MIITLVGLRGQTRAAEKDVFEDQLAAVVLDSHKLDYDVAHEFGIELAAVEIQILGAGSLVDEIVSE